MKSLIFLLFISLSFSLISDEIAFEKFQQFIKKYHKRYHSIEEYLSRFSAFRNNLNILESKKLQKIPSTHHEISLTKFSDLSDEEFRKKYLGLKYDR